MGAFFIYLIKIKKYIMETKEEVKESINSNLMTIYQVITGILFVIFISVGVYYFKQALDMGEVYNKAPMEAKRNLFFSSFLSCFFSLFLLLHIIIVSKIRTKINL